MPAEDYEQGVQGAGSAWEQGVEGRGSDYEGGATEDAANEYQSNASASGDSYAAGIAEYLGIDSDQVTVDDEYESGVSGAGSAWRQGVQGSGDRWEEGVQGKGSEYEQAAAEAGDDWFAGYREGVQQ